MLRLVQVVNALKALQRSLVYGEEVSRLLQASPVWAQYEQQRHDLFIQVNKRERNSNKTALSGSVYQLTEGGGGTLEWGVF